ncbi:hypothetical protein BN2476_110114 [Paraburkholderia piptadeniae]|uniref:Uncharacterized protein n=1 Tax=Paraburkholderia piptadeniae TaxID=1701573 RepID=A0A1N7RPU9_9BURK|nr:hypothetical protein BN2476_110114 [Paraburkholderia piptadeniae]
MWCSGSVATLCMRERDRSSGAFVLRIGRDPNVFDIPRDWHEYLPKGGDPHAVKIRARTFRR